MESAEQAVIRDQYELFTDAPGEQAQNEEVSNSGGDPLIAGKSEPVPKMAGFDTVTTGTSNIQVFVRRDRKEAMIEVSAQEGVAPEVTIELLLESLKTAGVVFGIDAEALEILAKVQTLKSICGARALQPVDGDNGLLKYHIDIESQGKPTLLEDGRVDYKNLNNFINIEAGQLLVEKISSTPGTPGKDVLGLLILANSGQEAQLPVGKNVTVVDNCQLVAAIPGQLHIAHGRVSILPTIIIEGDVDYSTGNIDFQGSVIIHGSVQSGFSVKASGNVEVRGNICGGVVEANNITVRNGIQGMNRGDVKANNRLVAKFIENATVYAGIEAVVSDVVLHSKVFAGVRIILEGQRGLALGGRLSAGQEIRVRTAGNEAQVPTNLEVAVDPFLKDEYFMLRDELAKAEVRAEELKRSLAYRRLQGVENLSTVKREYYEKMEEEFNTLPDSMEDLQLRIEDVRRFLYSLEPGCVYVAKTMHAGVRVAIGPLSRTIDGPLQYLKLYGEGREIRFTSYR